MPSSRTPQNGSLADPVTDYALAVDQGRKIAGPDIRNACRRHLQDLDHGPGRGLTWDVAAATRAIEFFREVLRLDAGDGEVVPFELLDWQAFIVGALFGWKEADGFRRFRMAYVESGKGSGKSPLAAGIGLYLLTADGESRAEVYAAATKKDQAMILFRDAVAMVGASKHLGKRLTQSGTGLNVWNLAYLQTGSFFRPISSENGQSGTRVHGGLLDEVHEHKTNEVVEMMRAGTKGRRQALIFMITNSGHDRTSVCFDYHEYGRQVCDGSLDDDSFFAFICSLDEGEDPFKSEDCWQKANPSLGQTITTKYLREQVTQARGIPSKESLVRRLNFCQWVDAANPWISADVWQRCETEFDLAELEGLPCYGGLDLSGTRDLTAFALYFPTVQRAFVEFWTPGDTLLDRARTDRVPYEIWRDRGFIHVTPGQAVEYARVATRLGELRARFDVQGVAFDPYRIKYFEPELAAASVELTLIPHGQGYRQSQDSGLWMPRSIELLEDDISKGQLGILKNPCLRWNASSAVTMADQAENRIFAKRKATGRIDGVVALAMARGAADAPSGLTSSAINSYLDNVVIA